MTILLDHLIPYDQVRARLCGHGPGGERFRFSNGKGGARVDSHAALYAVWPGGR